MPVIASLDTMTRHEYRRTKIGSQDADGTSQARSGMRYVEEQDGWLELYFLPPYSSELNPDEYVWNDLKNNAPGRKLITSREELREFTISH